MLTIEKIDTGDKVQVKRFVDLPYKLYKDCPQWVPPLFIDANLPLNRKKHPFFEHSEADFFLAIREREVVGRICAAIKRKKLISMHLRRSMTWMWRAHSLRLLRIGRKHADSIR